MDNSIARHLIANDMTQDQFAELAKVSQATVNDWVHGNKKPDPSRIPHLARLMNVKPVTLLTEFHLYDE